MKTTIRLIQEPELGKKGKIPVTIEWKGERMIRGHSLQSSVKEIVRMTQTLDVVKINIIGNQSTGKTTLAESVAHLIHKLSMDQFKTPFAIKFFTRKELVNFEATLATLEPTNHVLCFDDISFLQATTDKRTIETIKKAFTEIRHLQGGQDVKIVTIFNSHYQMSVTKYLRQSDFAYYTSVGSSDYDNVLQVVGKRYGAHLTKFQKIFHAAVTKNKFTFNLDGKKKFFIYPFRKPFGPALFYNSDTLRIVVFPKREWIEKFCPACNKSQEVTMKDGLEVDDFIKDISHKFGHGLSRSAVRIKLFQNGFNVYPKNVKRILVYIDKYVKGNLPNMQALANYYDFKDDKVLVHTKYIKDLPKPKVELSVGGILEFNVQELKSFFQEKKPRDNWVEPFYKQTKQDNLKEYHKLHELYKDKPEPILAERIKALSNVIKNQG